MADQRRKALSEDEKILGEVLREADPSLTFYVERHEQLIARNAALLERVTVLERAMEQIARNDPMNLTAQEIAERALDA